MFLLRKMPLTFFWLFGVLSGFLIPFIFIALDLHELNLAFSLQNILDVFNSQNIYLFSVIVFPFLTGIIFSFIKITQVQKNQIEQARDFNNKVLKDLSSMVIIINSRQKKVIYYNDAFNNFLQSFGSKYQNIGDYLVKTNLIQKMYDFSISSEVVHELENSRGELSYYSCARTDINGDFVVYNLNCLDDLLNYQKIIERQNQQMVIAARLSALGEMAAGIAHEINNPLAIIKGKCFLIQSDLRKGKLTLEAKEKYFADISRSIERTSKIISSLRTMARGDDAKEEKKLHKIFDVVEDVKELALVRAKKETDVTIEYNGHEDELIYVRRVEFGQVIINLFNNAFDAIEHLDEKWVKLNIRVDKERVYLEVIDCGHGIQNEVVNKLFTPMFTTKGVGKGTGLGLSLSLSIVKAEGGELYYDSTSPNTKFVISVPRPNDMAA